MTSTQRFGIVVVLVCCMVATAASEAAQDDAGTGADASGDVDLPTSIGWGGFAGRLGGSDIDVYGGAASTGPVCVQAQASGDAPALFGLGLRSGADTRGVVTGLSTDPAAPTVLAVAGSGVTPLVGLGGGTGVVSYSFAWSPTTGAGSGDAGSGRDAGSILSGALPLSGPCTAGQLSPFNGLGDTMDVFSFAGREGATIVYSLGSVSDLVSLRVVAPDGSTVGSVVTSNGLAMATLPSTGDYTLSVSQTQGTSSVGYLIGMVGDPGGNPCRPTCMVS